MGSRRPRKISDTGEGPRRRAKADLPQVPTYQPDPHASAPNRSSDDAAKDDPADEAIRRMVEAAYT